MFIYRNGQKIQLTREEMEAAYKQMEHIYHLDTAERYFREKINYEEYEGDEKWLSEFSQKYGFTPEQAMDPNSPHYAMEELLTLFEELQSGHQCQDRIWNIAVQMFMKKKRLRKEIKNISIPVKIRFYAVMEDDFEYSEIRDFKVYPSAKELEELLREFKQEAEDLNDSIAVSFGTEYAGAFENKEASSPYAVNKTVISIPDEMAINFGTPAGKRMLMTVYGDSNTSYSGTNQDGENILLEICPDGIRYVCYQHNGWVRINWYDEKGNPSGETFDGKWK